MGSRFSSWRRIWDTQTPGWSRNTMATWLRPTLLMPFAQAHRASENRLRVLENDWIGTDLTERLGPVTPNNRHVQHRSRLPLCAADSTDRRNTLGELLCW